MTNTNLPKNVENVPQIYDLKECVANNYYDFVLLIATFSINADIRAILKEYGVPKNKFVEVTFPVAFHFQVERALIYYKEHAAEFEMFATEPSRIRHGLIPKFFNRKLFNFGCLRMPQYLMAFNDLHNFWMPIEDYRKIFRPEYLNLKLPLKDDTDCVESLIASLNFLSRENLILTRRDAKKASFGIFH